MVLGIVRDGLTPTFRGADWNADRHGFWFDGLGNVGYCDVGIIYFRGV